MKKLICALMTVVLALLLFACASGTDTGETTKKAEGENTVTVEETADPNLDEYGRPRVESSLPEGLDLSGKTVTIYIREKSTIFDARKEFIAEAINGEPVNDAIWKREHETEEELHCNVEVNVCGGSDLDGSAYITAVRKSVQAGDGAYDICASYAYYGVQMGNEKLMYNLYELPYIDLTKPWWNQNFVDEMTLYGQIYFISGSLNLTATQCTNAIFFNKVMLKNYFGDLDLYSVVNDGKWTLDYFNTLVKDVYEDKNGDSARDEDDTYGFSMHPCSIPVDAYLDSFDLAVTTKGDDGIPEYTYGNEKTISAFEKLFALCTQNQGVYFNDKLVIETYYNAQKKFFQSQRMFLMDIFYATDSLRDMKDDYGVLPLFKYDESQSGYYTNAADVYSLMSICSGSKDAETASAVMERMAQKSYETVVPAYFEIALKQKYARDSADAQMYDIILDGCRFNFGYVYSVKMNNPTHIWRTLLMNRQTNFASTYKTTETLVKKLLDKLVSFYSENAA